jgi:hypothetical protein
MKSCGAFFTKLGLKARELQSITWEAARALFPADEKNEKKTKEADIWKSMKAEK